MKPHLFAEMVSDIVMVARNFHGADCLRALVIKALKNGGVKPDHNNRSLFHRGDRVRKKSGSAWQGTVVGEYSTNLTPEGYAVESEFHPGSVQSYPASALELVKE